MESFETTYERITEEYRLNIASASDGNQIKYKKGDYYYKVDELGNEGLVEVLCGLVCKWADIPHAYYSLVEINGKKGCKSKNFLKDGDRVVTFMSLYRYRTGRDLNVDLLGCNTPEERYNFILNFTKDLNFIQSYLQKVISLDFLTLNEDRHLRNLAVISNQSGIHECIIFDNGNSLLTCNTSVNRYDTPESAVKKVCSKPFSGSPSTQLKLVGGNCLSIDYIGLLLDLSSLKCNYKELDILKYQLKKYKSLYWKNKFYGLYYNGQRVGTRILSKMGSNVNVYDTCYIVKKINNLNKLDMVREGDVYVVKGVADNVPEIKLSNEILDILDF